MSMFYVSLAGQTHAGRESGQIPIINWVSDEWRRAFFGMLFRERGVIMEDLPLQNMSQFMFTPTSLGALLQYKSLM